MAHICPTGRVCRTCHPEGNFRGFERVTFSKVTTKEGVGTEEDMHREVTRYFDDRGELVFKLDPQP
jgi:hypothetical protein